MTRSRNQWLPSAGQFVQGVGDAGAGFAQGVTFNFLDDLLRAVGGEQADNWLADAQNRNPLAYGAGNLVGAMTGPMKIPFPRGDFVQAGVATALDALPTRLLAKSLRGTSDDLSALTASQFMKRAAVNDAASGGLYAAGGYEVAPDGGDDSATTLASKALVHGAAGAAAGAGAAAAVPALGRLWMRSRLNAPTKRGEPPLDAPLALTPAALAGRDLRQSTPDELRGAAFSMVDEAVARDEAVRRLMPGPVMQTGMPPRTALDVAGPNVQSLFGLLSRDPEMRAQLMERVAASARENAQAKLRALTYNGQPVRTSIPKEVDGRVVAEPLPPPSTIRVQDLVEAIDDPDAHAEWVRLARAINARGRERPPALKRRAAETDEQFAARQQAQREAFDAGAPDRSLSDRMRADEARDLARQVAKALRDRIARAAPDEALDIYRRLDGGDLAEKLRAAGMKIDLPKDRAGGLNRSDESLRGVMAAADRPTRFERVDGPPGARRRTDSAADNLTARSPNRQAVGKEDLSDAPLAMIAPDLRGPILDALSMPRRLSYTPASRADAPLIGAAPDFAPRAVDWGAPSTAADKGFYYAGKLLPIVGDQTLTSDSGVIPGAIELTRYYLDLMRQQEESSRNARSPNPWIPRLAYV